MNMFVVSTRVYMSPNTSKDFAVASDFVFSVRCSYKKHTLNALNYRFEPGVSRSGEEHLLSISSFLRLDR